MKKAHLRILVLISIILITTILIVSLVVRSRVQEVNMKNIQEAEDMMDNEENYLDENIDSINDLSENVLIVELPNEENKNSTPNKILNDIPYYIKVNYGAQVVTIYKQDNDGNYIVPIKAMVCSTGTHTPKSGVYKISNRWRWLGLQGDVYGQYCTQITGNILFHSVPYLEKGNPGSLEYWEYDKLGTYASAGCIRLTVVDAMWIYNNCKRGTNVEFYSSSDPGPLGKPISQRISNSEGDLKNWDPTDPDSNSPWKNLYERYEDEKNNISEKINVESKENTEIKSNTQENESIINNEEIDNNVQINEIINTEKINVQIN